jgi:hypothetical protein
MRILEDLNVVEKVNYKLKLARMTLSLLPQISVQWVLLLYHIMHLPALYNDVHASPTSDFNCRANGSGICDTSAVFE